MGLVFRQFGLVFLLASLLAACTASPASQLATPIPPPTVPVATPRAASYTDALGRTVALPAVPQRIVSLAPSVTELLFAIGAGEQVVGVTTFCNYPAEAESLPEIGGFSAKTISIEAIVALKPELVIAGTASQQPVVEALEQLNIPVFVLAPTTLEEVYSGLTQLGAITGNAEQAAEVTATMHKRVDAVVARVATIPADQRPTVFYEVFDEPLMSSGPQTFIGQLLDLAGAANIFGDATEDYPQISAEVIIERNPAVIVAPSSHADRVTPELLAARPGWEAIRAVQEKRVYIIDGDIVSRPGPRLADALEALAAALYPEHP